MREETTAEHIARDMREGRFPQRSAPQQIDEHTSTGHERRLVESVAQALLTRYHDRALARGYETPCATKINECVPSYRDDFIADAVAAIDAYRKFDDLK